ncbi:MAG: hypothetical protein ABEK36_06040 [Candidatus Aenigmatarchaeota archaeon]
MISKKRIKQRITELNNFILSIPLFYIGVGFSSFLWKIKIMTGQKPRIGWKNIDNHPDNLEKMERMW